MKKLLNEAREYYLNKINSPYLYKRIDGVLYYTFRANPNSRCIGKRPFGWHRVA